MDRTADSTVDPRVSRSRRVVSQATLEELAERGYGALAIDAVAARAGVSRSTVYRHWRGKLALVVDALETLNVQPDPASDDPAAGVGELLRHLASALTQPPLAGCLPALIEAARHDEAVRGFLHSYNARRRSALTAAVTAGIERGEIAPSIDPEVAATALAGAILYRQLMTSTPADGPFIDTVMHTVLGTVPSPRIP